MPAAGKGRLPSLLHGSVVGCYVVALGAAVAHAEVLAGVVVAFGLCVQTAARRARRQVVP